VSAPATQGTRIFSQTETNKVLLIKNDSGHNRHKWLFLNQEGDEVGIPAGKNGK
jgi:hypothetical protein